MQTAKQLSVTLVNKPGRLAALLAALNKEKVNLRAFAVMDSGERGTLRFVPDDFPAAREVLEKVNLRFEASDVLLVEVHLNIGYAYCSFNSGGGAKGGVLAVIKVNDLAKAQRVLSENGTTARRTRPGRRPVHAR